MRWWSRFGRKQVHVDVTEVQKAKARREEAERKLNYARQKLAHDEEVTIRPLRQMSRENHVTERIDELIRNVRHHDPGGYTALC